jgi:hypothetical protein
MATIRNHYLNNRDLLAEIAKSKASFSTFLELDYQYYDIIVHDVNEINIKTISDAKRVRAAKLSASNLSSRKALGEKIKLSDCEVEWNTVPVTDLIFRVITFEHIPLAERKKNPKTVADNHERLNFIPFFHYKFNENGTLDIVGKSHWKGDFATGSFCKTKGQLTNNLCKMILKLCERYLTRGNLRNYTYADEMRGHAVLQLTQMCLQFDESKSENAFAYLSSSISNSVIRILNQEKRHQEIRDDILEMNGLNPSSTRTNEGDFETSFNRYSDY